eukprot:TRINITY_DN6758_c0_g1_i2.p2 TRINITY_DN6758_c0_g1~~TRINITY_DN6758_c0_g1_i2.p2  ORF type:complete len:119 (+),score=17.72 TRINITY_DN6758_c0_g1_i2:217-573(+)
MNSLQGCRVVGSFLRGGTAARSQQRLVRWGPASVRRKRVVYSDDTLEEVLPPHEQVQHIIRASHRVNVASNSVLVIASLSFFGVAWYMIFHTVYASEMLKYEGVGDDDDDDEDDEDDE